MELLSTLTTGLAIALLFGFFAQKIKISPIVGYLIAGIIVSPNSPGITADYGVVKECAEIGVILLMFSVGLHFKVNDLIAVKKIAIFGAVSQIVISTLISAILVKILGWSWIAGIVFGISISVASTVVLTRVLSDNKTLNTPTGHVAIGWLVMEDIFTVLVLVLLPIFFGENSNNSNIILVLLKTIGKLALFVGIVGVIWKFNIIDKILMMVAKNGTKELFILSTIVIALGIAICASEMFGASMALGAFLAGMVVGKSNFSLRVTSEAISITDIFAVLFFVSVGMLFNVAKIYTSWKLIIILFFVVLIVKPLVAILVVKYLKEPTKKAIYIGIALGQIGEFSFLLASIASVKYNIFPQQAYNAMILVSIVTITLNTVIYHFLDDILNFLTKKGFFKININYEIDNQMENIVKDTRHVIIVGYGPVGKTISNILIKSKITVVIIELNIDTVKIIKDKNIEELKVIYGDATMKEVLLASGILTSEALIISSTFAPAKEIIDCAVELNSKIKILMNTNYIKQAKVFKKENNAKLKNIDLIVHSGEGSAALTLAKEVFDIFKLNNFKEEVNNIYNEIISM